MCFLLGVNRNARQNYLKFYKKLFKILVVYYLYSLLCIFRYIWLVFYLPGNYLKFIKIIYNYLACKCMFSYRGKYKILVPADYLKFIKI
jgi:hypothetical protein